MICLFHVLLLFVVDLSMWLFVADVVLCQCPLAMLFGTCCTVLCRLSYVHLVGTRVEHWGGELGADEGEGSYVNCHPLSSCVLDNFTLS